jgi:hypothetical protein
MKPETFSCSLAQMKEAEVVSKGTEVKIGGFCVLAQFCCKDCTAQEGDCPDMRCDQELTAVLGKEPKGQTLKGPRCALKQLIRGAIRTQECLQQIDET